MYKTSMVALASKSPYVNIKFAMIFDKCRNLIFCISDFVCSNFSIMHLSLKSWNEDDKDISRWSSTQKQLAFFTNRIKMFVHSQKCWILKNIGNHLNVCVFEVVVKTFYKFCIYRSEWQKFINRRKVQILEVFSTSYREWF